VTLRAASHLRANQHQLYHRVPRTALPIHFFRHFCWRIYCSATTHSENRTAFGNFCVWNRHGQAWSRDYSLTTAIPDAAFSAIRLCSYTARLTQYDRPS